MMLFIFQCQQLFFLGDRKIRQSPHTNRCINVTTDPEEDGQRGTVLGRPQGPAGDCRGPAGGHPQVLGLPRPDHQPCLLLQLCQHENFTNFCRLSHVR